MDAIIAVLRDNPLLLLFLVAAIGYPLGRVRIAGASLGVAAVLFVGLAVGALSPDLKLPDAVYTLGLVLFVYPIGLSSGTLFFSNLRRKGLGFNLLVLTGLLFAFGLAAGAHFLLGLSAPLTAGLYAGSLTNTPALAGVIEHVKAVVSPQFVDAAAAEPVVAYSMSYPMGVLGMILVIYVLRRIWKVDYAAEARAARDIGGVSEPLHSTTLHLTVEPGLPVAELKRRHGWNVIFGRLLRDGKEQLVTGQTILRAGDRVSMVGAQKDLDLVQSALGKPAVERLEFDLTRFAKKRFFVSNPQVVGRRITDLHLEKYSAIVSRVRRGDIELLPAGDTTLLLGDQVRVLAPHDQIDALTGLFGDSYRGVSEIDVMTFGLGVALGLLLGMLPIPLPGGLTLKLGAAGGPLIVALILGALGRTGPVVWVLPYSANLTLRQVGLIIFLAGIGTRSGYAFFSSLAEGSGLAVFLAGAAITVLTTLLAIWIGYKVMRIPMSLLMGILSGMQTQPAVLGYALEETGNELPNVGYAMVYPVAMIGKIVLAQILLIIFL